LREQDLERCTHELRAMQYLMELAKLDLLDM
jgi:hypothetical protein